MKIIRFLTILLIIILTACHSRGSVNQTVSSDQIINGDDVNDTINLIAPEDWNSFKLGDPIVVYVLLKSDRTVILDDHDVKIYLSIGNNWSPIENENPHPSNIYIIEPIGPEAFRGAEVIAVPNLDQQVDSAHLRIVVSANFYDNDVKGKQVFSYVDVTLHP